MKRIIVIALGFASCVSPDASYISPDVGDASQENHTGLNCLMQFGINNTRGPGINYEQQAVLQARPGSSFTWDLDVPPGFTIYKATLHSLAQGNVEVSLSWNAYATGFHTAHETAVFTTPGPGVIRPDIPLYVKNLHPTLEIDVLDGTHYMVAVEVEVCALYLPGDVDTQ